MMIYVTRCSVERSYNNNSITDRIHLMHSPSTFSLLPGTTTSREWWGGQWYRIRDARNSDSALYTASLPLTQGLRVAYFE